MAQLRQQCDADALSYKSQVAALQGDLSALKSKHFALEQTAQQSDAELAELRTRLFGASSELAEAKNALAELKARTKSILEEQARLQALCGRGRGVRRRKDDQIADLQEHERSLQEVVKKMKAAAEKAALEKAALAAELQTATARAEAAERKAAEARSLRPSLKEETAKLLKTLKLAPSALEASLAKRGLGVVELYGRVVSLEEEVEKMKKAKEEAEMYLTHVLKEVEEKTPQLLQQQAEYQQMVNGQQRLNRMYAELSKCGRAARLTRRELAEKKHRLAEAEQQAAQFEALAQDLKKQVHALLVQQIDATHAPSDREVCYTSVTELERVNQDLLAKLHRLEAAQTGAQTGAQSDGKAETGALAEELKQLKASREAQAALLETITKQRDMYRVLLAQKDGKEAATEEERGVEAGLREAKARVEAQLKGVQKELKEEKQRCAELREKSEEAASVLAAVKRALSTEQLCGQQSKETAARLEQLVGVMEEKTKKMSDEAMLLQQRLSAVQKELLAEKQKVGVCGAAQR